MVPIKPRVPLYWTWHEILLREKMSQYLRLLECHHILLPVFINQRIRILITKVSWSYVRARQNLSIPHAAFALVKQVRASPDAGPTAVSFFASAATSVAFMHSAAIDAMTSVSIGLCIHTNISKLKTVYKDLIKYVKHIYLCSWNSKRVFIETFFREIPCRSGPPLRNRHFWGTPLRPGPSLHATDMAGRGIAKRGSAPPSEHRGDEGYGQRPPSLAAWLHHNGAGTSGANWLHYIGFPLSRALILWFCLRTPARCALTTTRTSAGRCLFGQFVWVAPGGKRGLGWIHRFPSSLEAWNKLMHAVNGNTAADTPAGSTASGAWWKGHAMST